MTIPRGLKILAYKTWLRLRGQRYDEERALVEYDKSGFRGLAVGILEANRVTQENLLLCHYSLIQYAHNGGHLPLPHLFWNEGGRLVCCCRETPVADREGYALVFPFVCFSDMPEFQRELKVPGIRPEVTLQVVRVCPRLLAESFSSIIEAVERRDDQISGGSGS